MNILEAISDPNLLMPFLADKNGSIASWMHWIVALKVIHGLAITRLGELKLLKQCTGRSKARPGGFQTTLLLTGRRSGKSRIAAVAGAFEAVLAGHERKLAKGEKGVVLIVSPTKSQSRIVRDYIRAIFQVPMLAREIVAETREGFELRNGIRIQILAGDFKSVRGFTVVAAIIDEICFFGYGDEDKIKSDTELVRAIQPSLATVNGRLICISSPYARRGWSYAQFKRYWGNDRGSVLVWNCASRVMNPTLPQSVIDQAFEEDPAAARAEYGGEFRDDIAAFLTRELIERVVVPGRQELPPQAGVRYAAFVDISGGRVDDAALAIAHLEGGIVVIDKICRFKPPFSPDQVIGQMCRILALYKILRVIGDNYSAEFVKSSFEVRGFRYGRTTPSAYAKNPLTKVGKPKGQLYLEFLPRLCSGEVELLDNDVLINQLASLERRTRAGGRDIIDHPPGGHDDLANVAAGVCDAVIHKPVSLRPLDATSGRGDDDSVSAKYLARKREYEREMAFLSQPDPDPTGILTAMQNGTLRVVK